MTQEVTNIDDILVPREQAILKNEQIPAQPMQPMLEQSQQPKRQEESAKIDHLNESEEKESIVDIKSDDILQDDSIEKKSDDSEKKIEEPRIIDEYGNKTNPPRMYTEEELQQRIRERLSRDKHAGMPQQQVQQAAKDFTPDPNSEESWESQLEAFVDKTIEKRERKVSERQWQEQENARQAEFESKFTSGMSKYQDFNDVVSKAPITNGIMLAARALDNPAAFVYGAAKLHPQELSRIAQIQDPYAQAAEVGRLHEKMVKARRTTSQAPKPIEAPRGDVPAEYLY